jgi:signal transduction histidine kinase
MELSEDEVELRQLVADCVNFVRTQATINEVAIVIDMPEALPRLRADELRLKQVMLNLLSNAVKFSRRGGSVTVSACAALDGGITVVVRDTGVGMAADEIGIALQPFRQVDSTLSRRYAGTGLGLPLAKSLVERHGGTLHIESERGAGTSVIVALPASRAVRSMATLEAV